MPQPTLTLTPRKSALLAGHDNRLDLLVRVPVSYTHLTLPTNREV